MTAPSAHPIEQPTEWDTVGTLAQLHDIVMQVIGSTDPAAAAGMVGTFPVTMPFPDGAVIAGLLVDATDLRLSDRLDDPELPIENRVEVVVHVPQAIGDVQAFYTERMIAAGYSATRDGAIESGTDIASVRELDYTEVGDEPGGEVDVEVSLRLRQFDDQDYTTVEVAHTIREDAEAPRQPAAMSFDDAPIPPDYQLATARISVIEQEAGVLVAYAAEHHNDERNLTAGIEFFSDQLPTGPWSRATDSRDGAFPDQRFFQIDYAGLGEGRVATQLRGGNSFTILEIRVETLLERPASLAPFAWGN